MDMSSPAATHRVRPVVASALAILLALVLTGCTDTDSGGDGAGDRPDVATWTPIWDQTKAIIPDLETLGDPLDPDVCDETVARLRDAREDLHPTPDEVVDEAVDTWMIEATSVFFECFEADIGADTAAESYEELARLEAEIDTALATGD